MSDVLIKYKLPPKYSSKAMKVAEYFGENNIIEDLIKNSGVNYKKVVITQATKSKDAVFDNGTIYVNFEQRVTDIIDDIQSVLKRLCDQ